MNESEPSTGQTAAALLPALSLLFRRIRQTKALGDLTLAESSALSQLRHGPLSSAQLARAEHITPQSMGTTVAALEARALIQRAPDPSDGRRQLLSLTAAGTDSVQARRDRRNRQMAEALESFSPAERRQLLEAVPLLEKLTERLPGAPATDDRPA